MKFLELSRYRYLYFRRGHCAEGSLKCGKHNHDPSRLQSITGKKTEKHYAFRGLPLWKSVCRLGLSTKCVRGAAARIRELTGIFLMGSSEACDENRLIGVSTALRRRNISKSCEGRGFQWLMKSIAPAVWVVFSKYGRPGDSGAERSTARQRISSASNVDRLLASCRRPSKSAQRESFLRPISDAKGPDRQNVSQKRKTFPPSIVESRF